MRFLITTERDGHSVKPQSCENTKKVAYMPPSERGFSDLKTVCQRQEKALKNKEKQPKMAKFVKNEKNS